MKFRGLVATLAVCVLIAFLFSNGLRVATASGKPPTTVEEALEDPKSHGGYVLEDPRCGCAALQKANSPKPWPTRCDDANKNKKSRPKNKNGNLYPPHTYPNGFPDPPGGALTEVPFPGWPAVKPGDGKRNSKWGTTMREEYRKDYYEKSPPEFKAPGFVPPNPRGGAYPKKPETGWEGWQIHHILERKHNGTDDKKNLVPMYNGRKGKAANEHDEYTKWWQQIIVDSEFAPKKHKSKLPPPAVWSQIMGCDVVAWP